MRIEMNNFVALLERKQIKNINLRIQRTGEVKISAPIKMPLDIIRSFLQHKCSWIERQRYRLLQLNTTIPQKLVAGEHIPFQGIQYELQLHKIDTNPYIELKDNQIHFFVKPEATASYKELVLIKWYRLQMENILPGLINKWQAIMNVTVNQVKIKRMKSRWGSCHPIKKHITLNLRLIEKPSICLEYVIVHELVHLFETGHNKRFYTLMSYYLPDWKKIKNLLH